MRLHEEFAVHDAGDEQIMVATGSMVGNFNGLVRSNATAAFIVDQLKEDTTEEQIVEAMYAQYDAPKEVIAADVARIIAQLRSIGAIVE